MPAESLVAQKGRNRLLTTVPVVGMALLPKLVCAACWPAYTAALGTLGIGFFDYTPYLVPLMTLALIVAMGSLARLAYTRRRLEPLLLGAAAAATVIIGKFVVESDALMYVGIGTLMVASLFPWRSRAPACCT